MSSDNGLLPGGGGGGRIRPTDLLLALTRGTTTTETGGGMRLGGGVGIMGGGRGRSLNFRKPVEGRKDDKDVPVIDLEDEDDDKPTPSPSQSKGNPGSGSMDVIPCPEDTRIAQMVLKMSKEIRQEYEAQAIMDNDRIQALEARVDVVTQEREELKRKLAQEKVTTRSLEAGAKKAEEELRLVNSILGGISTWLPTANLLYGAGEPEVDSQQGYQEEASRSPGGGSTSAIINQEVEMTFSEVKQEPPESVSFYEEEYQYQDNDMGYFGYQRVMESSEPPVENDGDESVAVVLGMITVEAPPPPPPTVFMNINHRPQQKSRKLLRKYKKSRRRPRKVPAKVPTKLTDGVPRVVQKRKKMTDEICEDVHAVVYGSERDRTLFGLRSSPSRRINKVPLQRKPKAPRRVRRLSASISTASTSTASHSTASTLISTATAFSADVAEGGANPLFQIQKRPRLPPRLAYSDEELALKHGKDESTRDEAGHFCLCGISFGKKLALTQHLKYFGVWKIKCEDCEDLFYSTYNLRKHMTKVHKKTLPAGMCGCSKCGKIFPKEDRARHRNLECSG